MNGQAEVVVITGATAGVGRATVREFAKNGASIGLLARDTDRLELTRKEVEALGGEPSQWRRMWQVPIRSKLLLPA